MLELMESYEAAEVAAAISADILNLPEFEADELTPAEVRALTH